MQAGDLVLCIVTNQRYVIEKMGGRTIKLIRIEGGYKSTWWTDTFDKHFKLEES